MESGKAGNVRLLGHVCQTIVKSLHQAADIRGFLQGVPLKSTPLIFSKCQIWEKMAESQSRPPKIFLSVRFVNSAIFSKFSSRPPKFFLSVRFVNSTIFQNCLAHLLASIWKWNVPLE